ncbi:Sir2 silent information regulator family NAD-dependent deacetylase [Methanobrevibacter sp.]|uniref:Sir2 silent information regulator family NAD-dependent deacetylase n=1 Tax=Methanobrevibacter sp. TaxID=66852 RepID=UPI00389004FB
MDRFVQRLDRAKEAIDDGDFIVIGAGAGLSAAAGIEYSGKRFTDNFQEFIKKYSMTDMYSSGFYPFKTSEEKWAYWAKHIILNRFQVGKTDLYQKLLKLVENKDYFVITTNVEHQFWINGFEDKRIFATQGDYGLLQCGEACHDKLYYNEDLIREMVERTVDCRIPPDLIPMCPICGAEMETNLRKDNLFVQDEKWYEANNRYADFLSKINGNKVVFLELGVGYNTPSIIKYPFEQWTYDNENATLIRINRSFPGAIKENESKTIGFDEDMDEIFDYWLSRIF